MSGKGKNLDSEKPVSYGLKRKGKWGLVLSDGLSISGVKYIVGNAYGLIRRVLWFLILFGATSSLLMFSYFRFEFFLGNPKSTDIILKNEGYLEFPAVMICNLNRMRSTKLFSIRPPAVPRLLGNHMDVYASSVELMRIMSHLNDPEDTWKLRQHYVKQYWHPLGVIFNGRDDDKVVQNAVYHNRHRIEDMLVSCRWKDMYCGPENFTALNTDLGVCYQFIGEGDDALITDNPGTHGGLSLTLNAETQEYLENFATISGFKVIIGNPGYQSKFLMNNGFVIAPGQETFVALDKTQLDQLPDDGTCGKRNFQKCIFDCYARYSMDVCGCVTYYMSDTLPHCKPNLVATCSIFAEASLVGTKNYSTYCGDCKPECKRSEYQILLYSTKLADSFTKVYMIKNLEKYTRNYKQAMMIKWLYSVFNMNGQYREMFNALDMSTSSIFGTLTEMLKIHASLMMALNNLEEKYPENKDIMLIKQDLNNMEEAVGRFKDFALKSYFLSGYDDSKDMHEDFRIRVLLSVQNGSSQFEGFISGMNSTAPEFWNETTVMQQLENLRNAIYDTNQTDTILAAWKEMVLLKDRLVGVLETVKSMFTALHKTVVDDDRVRYLIEEDMYSTPLTMVKDDLTKLNIYYKSLVYTEIIQHHADHPINLFCDIGGTTGLCVGGSILTVFELIDVLCAFCSRRYRGLT